MNLSKYRVKRLPQKLAWEKGKEEWEELGGMIFISPPCFRTPETPMNINMELLKTIYFFGYQIKHFLALSPFELTSLDSCQL